jgi:hypothetical protein
MPTSRNQSRRGNNHWNVTRVNIMANSNRVMHNQEEFDWFVDEMWDLNELLFNDQENLSYVFGGDPYVNEVHVGENDFGVEVGSKQHRGHIHVLVTITHQIPRYSTGKLHARLKNWFDSQWSGDDKSKGWNIRVGLAGGGERSNYNNKEQRYAMNDAIDEDDEEVQRLSDPRDLLEETTNRSTVRKLEGNLQRPDDILQNGREYNRRRGRARSNTA